VQRRLAHSDHRHIDHWHTDHGRINHNPAAGTFVHEHEFDRLHDDRDFDHDHHEAA
jgi:hypothetical protein